MKKVLFTSESVTEGHPDKICDQISDAVLDEILKVDPVARVACETLTTTGIVMVVGEITTSEYVDIQSIVRNVLKDIGYTRAKYGFDASTCSVITSINEQSRDIALGVDSALEYKKGNEDKYNSVGAGDQGMMFGYACTETEEFMPLPITLAHKLSKRLSYVRKNDIDIYEKHDNKNFPSEDSGEWNENLLDKEINNLLDNFSKERISNIRKLIAKLENKMSKNDNVIKSKATNTQIPNVSPKLNSKRGFSSDDNFTKNIGIGLIAVGGLVTVTSLFTGLGVKTLVGVAIAGAGIIILVSENK